jgi:hypothetical protein
MAKPSELEICDEATAAIQKVIEKKLQVVEELKKSLAELTSLREEIIAGGEADKTGEE